MKKSDVVDRVLEGRSRDPGARGQAFAPSNIALCKYWGKRDPELNLPVTSSLSMSLGALGATTGIAPGAGPSDRVWLNGEPQEGASPFVRRVSAYLDLFRPEGQGFDVRTVSTVPVAAGLASSASGYAALALALDALFGWGLDRRALSILARLGSGSACRSVYDGFVEWHAGMRDDGMDSVAERMDVVWPDLRLGLLELSLAEKPVSSREAMKRTCETSALYAAWPEKVAADLMEVRAALRECDLEKLGRAAESNALAMHATMQAAWPPVLYWLPESVRAMHRVWAARSEGVPVYFTMDAGPNLKLIYSKDQAGVVQAHFPECRMVEPVVSAPNGS